MIKKATSKRERKHGKKVEDFSYEPKDESVKVIIDGYSIRKFKSKREADTFIAARRKESEAKNRNPTSYVFL